MNLVILEAIRSYRYFYSSKCDGLVSLTQYQVGFSILCEVPHLF